MMRFHRSVISEDVIVTPTLSHRLILPTDANHHGTLYAGSLLRMTLESAYATASRFIGPRANLVLRRVLNIECLKPVPVGTVIEIQGMILHQTQTYLIAGMLGSPLDPEQGPWMEALLGFAQIDENGRPAAFPENLRSTEVIPPTAYWEKLQSRMKKLIRIK